MFKIIFSVVLSFSIFGCSKNITIDKLNQDRVHELSIVNTRKGELNNQNSKIIILATYLNPIKTSEIDNTKENFLISIYLSKKNEKSKSSNNPFYQIHLNNNISMEDIKILDKKAKILKLIPVKNRWSSYYLIQFPKQKTKKLKITFENEQHNKTTLTFSKEF